jgi:hypothetical protein
MALEAVVGLSRQLGVFVLLLPQRVEHNPQARGQGGDLQHFALLHPSDVRIIVEVERARPFRADAAPLKARFGEHQNLGFLGNAQFAQDGRKVSMPRAVRQPVCDLFQPLAQLGRRIIVRSSRVVDRLAFEIELCLDTSCEKCEKYE